MVVLLIKSKLSVIFWGLPMLMDLQHVGIQQAVFWLQQEVTSGQSYEASTIVIYDSRVVPDLKIRL